MQIARVLAGSAAAAVMVLVPQAAFAADGATASPAAAGGYGGDVRWQLGRQRTAAQPTPQAALPSTGSSALDTAIAGAGLLLLVGGGAVVVASRRKSSRPPDARLSKTPAGSPAGVLHVRIRVLLPRRHQGATQQRWLHPPSCSAGTCL